MSRAGLLPSEWSSGEPVLDAVYLTLGHLLDHEDEYTGGWAEARAFIARLRDLGYVVISKEDDDLLVELAKQAAL